jgi:hypothetical protein
VGAEARSTDKERGGATRPTGGGRGKLSKLCGCIRPDGREEWEHGLPIGSSPSCVHLVLRRWELKKEKVASPDYR